MEYGTITSRLDIQIITLWNQLSDERKKFILQFLENYAPAEIARTMKERAAK